ncbi:Pre-rRNA-processing protein fhl1 [Mortierella sp. GBA43]|nr:Pre-rRNA-processing protein fhl1 [Mortierella sp. GBA43]
MDHTPATSMYPQATSSNAAVVAESSSEPVQAYAKLEGDSFCYYIRTLQVTFGRKASSSDHVDIHLGPTKAISRQHARLFYNFTTQRFEMMVFGKNGAFVNDQFVEKGVTVPLENRTKIQIGEVSFSFLLPKIETDEATSQDIVAATNMNTNTGLESPSQRNGTGSGSATGAGTGATAIAVDHSTNTSLKRDAQSVDSMEATEYSKDTKPPFSYASLIAQAINSTQERRLTLNGIYQYITQHYPYYQMAHNGWQNSIRHNLSLNKAFVKVPRSDSEPGKGAFWTIDQSCESQFANGVYKRNRRMVTTKPAGAAGGRSESPIDGDKPRKRINLGPDATSSALQSSTIAATVPSAATLTTGTQQPDLSQISEASLKLAALLQQNPGLLALNLATLTQSLSAADKETAHNAIITALLAASKVSNVKTGQASSNPLTTIAALPALTAPTATTLEGTTGIAVGTDTGTTQQSISTLQAVAAAIAAARNATNTTTPTSTTASSLTTPSAMSTPTLDTGVTNPALTLPSTSAAASPIAQLVAAAQAQAAAQARVLAQTQALVAATATITGTAPTSTTIPPSTSIPILTDDKAEAHAQVLALQAQARALAEAEEAEKKKNKEPQEASSLAPALAIPKQEEVDGSLTLAVEAAAGVVAVAVPDDPVESSTPSSLSQPSSDTSGGADGTDTSAMDTN